MRGLLLITLFWVSVLGANNNSVIVIESHFERTGDIWGTYLLKQESVMNDGEIIMAPTGPESRVIFKKSKLVYVRPQHKTYKTQLKVETLPTLTVGREQRVYIDSEKLRKQLLGLYQNRLKDFEMKSLMAYSLGCKKTWKKATCRLYVKKQASVSHDLE